MNSSVYQESEQLSPAGEKLAGEQTLCTIYQHPFGLIIIYIFTFIGLAGAFVLLSLLLPSDIKNSQSAYSLFSGIVILIIIIIGLLLLAVTYVYRMTKLIVTNKGIHQVLQKGLLQCKVMRFSLADIEDVTSDKKGIFANAFNYGILTIETAGELVNPTFNYCPNPNRVSEIILQAKDTLEFSNGTKDTPVIKQE
jgi:multidrug transporter EmrE-like cation transporter